ncbi:hypothetical protein WME79_27235 [Sorangium sp. So ce726]
MNTGLDVFTTPHDLAQRAMEVIATISYPIPLARGIGILAYAAM